MDSCDKFKLQFSSYLDGELSGIERKDIEEHFIKCPPCAETVRQIRIIQQSIRQMPQISSSPGFEQKLHQQIFNPNMKSTFFPLPLQNWKVPAMGSAIVLATVGMFMVFNHSTDGTKYPLNHTQGRYYPAASQLPASRQVNRFGSSTASSMQFESSTLINDSLKSDTTRLDRQGLKMVGEH